LYNRFTGKTCIVTGGARGIGAAIATRLALEGCNTAIIDIDEEAGRIRENELISKGFKAVFIKADVSIEHDVMKAVEYVFNKYNSIDVLVNNAGIGFTGRSIEEQTLEEWNRIISVNLTGPYLMSKHAVKYMKKKGGVIINIASTRALQSEPNTEPYSASKGGLVALTHSLAVSLAPYRIRVLTVSPGWIDTSMWQVPPRIPSLTRLDHLQHPAGRVGRPEDVASLVAYLASDEAEWMTGVNIIIDGGMITKMIYIDENIIEDSIALLTGDREFSTMVKKLIMGAKNNMESAKSKLRSIMNL